MSNIQPYVGSGLVRDARRSGRAISRYQAFGQVRIAKVDIETDVALAKVDIETDVALAKEDAVTTATGAAMGSVVRVAQLQRQLEQIAPEAAGRLAFLADDHMLSMGDIMQDLRRELRRR
jgi:hypothetical protein